jgi:hypothetical protein
LKRGAFRGGGGNRWLGSLTEPEPFASMLANTSSSSRPGGVAASACQRSSLAYPGPLRLNIS